MRRWSSSGALALTLVLAAAPAAAPAQAGSSLAAQLGLDRLRLGAIGVAYGPVHPRNVEPTQSYGIQTDYGEIARHWHVLFGVSYWGSQFTDETVDRFVDQLRESIRDPAGDDTIIVSRVRVSDIALEGDARWMPLSQRAFLQPYVGAGIGAHIVNAESKLIADTFVERALDNIAVGVTGLAGIMLTPSRHVGVGVEARYALLSNVRYGTVRATATYHFSGPPSRSVP